MREKGEKASNNHNVGSFANNPRKDAYPEEVMDLVIVIFTAWTTFSFSCWLGSNGGPTEKAAGEIDTEPTAG